jgi:hypothetical protein
MVVLALFPREASGLGFNTGMLYRYPWDDGVSMTRTQGWGDANPSHTESLFYAVDWDNGSGNWPVRSSAGGTLRCDPVGNAFNEGLGNYITIYNSIANQTSVYAHLSTCGSWGVGVAWPVTQGAPIGTANETGNADGVHLHFHVTSGETWNATSYSTVSFSMSDKSNFDEPEITDGPSDNVPVAYEPGGSLDTGIRGAYLAQSGPQPASESWWNVGATYHATTELHDEYGGPCRNTSTAFVHICPSDFGAGLAASQNYIDWKNVRHSVYRTNVAGHVKGQIQGSVSNFFRPCLPGCSNGPLARVMGAPNGPESGGIQSFQAGYLQRANGYGIRVDAYQCQPTCTLIAVLRWDARGIFCPTLNRDLVLNVADSGILAQAIATPGWEIEYDLNQDKATNVGDMGLLAARRSDANVPCLNVDP